jgi:CRP-like cAMP-binding protein
MGQAQNGFRSSNAPSARGRTQIATLAPAHTLTTALPAEKLSSQPRAIAPIPIVGLVGHNPKQNSILAALPAADFERIYADMEFVNMPAEMTLCEADAYLKHVYFPTSSVVSMMIESKTGASAETAVIGNDGMVGVNLFMGGGASYNRAVVKSAGYGFRLSAKRLMQEFSRGGILQEQLLRYTHALIGQMSQTAICNRHHNVTQQVCRLLLLTLDRLTGTEIFLTQEAIAAMVGVRRESIAFAAGALQEEGLIHYARGHINVIDRAGVESRSCECYACVKREYDRLKTPGKEAFA